MIPVPNTFVVQGDCLDVLRTFPDASISAVVTDPPYGLSKEPDMIEVLRHWLHDGEIYCHKGGGFMGKSWDSFVPGPEVWREVLRVLKPGGHALVFLGTCTYDLMVLVMRIAGFEIRDQLAWLYGSGFPKSLDVSKAIGQAQHAEPVITPHPTNACPGGPWCECTDRDERAQSGATKHPPHYEWPEGSDATAWSGWGTALKPAQEPIVLARKPFPKGVTVAANVLTHGTGGINVDGCRIGTEQRFNPPAVTQWTDAGYMGRAEEGKTVVGRWPANVIMDEVAAEILDEQSGTLTSGSKAAANSPNDLNRVYGAGMGGMAGSSASSGGASRFFYVAKTSRAEREAGLDHLPVHTAGELTDREDGSDGLNSPRAGAGRTSKGRRNTHPTVKPIALMRYLVRMITPPGGMVLDPYCGSGSTLCAAVLEGFSSVGIELTPEYIPIIEGRVEHYKQIAAKNGGE